MATSSSNEDPYPSYFDHFVCSICFEVLRDPVQCARNEHYFCKSCITRHLTRSQTCPVCQDPLTTTILRRTSRVVANLLQQFQSPRCRYANRGCTASVRHEVLLSHHEECDFAPVQCSNDGCEETMNRKDIARHERESCDFRPVQTCKECKQRMSQKEYVKHPCVLLKEIDKNKIGLAQVQKILREIQDEQRRQGKQIQRMLAMETARPCSTGGQHGKETGPQAKRTSSCKPTARPQRHRGEGQTKIFVAGSGSKSYEVFNWLTRQWTLHENALFFDHTNGFSFVYDNKIMICGGTRTNRVECLDMTNPSFSRALPMSLPKANCGKAVLYGDIILTFGDVISATHLDPPCEAEYQLFYTERGETKLSSYGVACVHENAIAIAGGYEILNKNSSELTDAVRLYNPNTKQLKTLAPLPYKVADAAVLAYNDNVIIILGGETEYGATRNDVLMYNISSQQCSKLPSMLKKRTQCAAVIMGDTIIAMGGSSGISRIRTPHKTAEYLVWGENTWKELPEMHRSRNGATACVLP